MGVKLCAACVGKIDGRRTAECQKYIQGAEGLLQRSSAWLEYNIVKAEQALLIKHPLTSSWQPNYHCERFQITVNIPREAET